MPVRNTMAQLIARVRLLIADPISNNAQFADQDIQDTLDNLRTDVRYEGLTIAPSILNNASTNNQAQTIYADYYSKYQWWESDVTLQAYSNGAAWVVVTPLASDYIVGHWQFELNVFASGTAPGQLPPVFATGKTYDVYGAAADLLELWAALQIGSYDVTVDGQTLRRSQIPNQKFLLANIYRRKALPRTAHMRREDVMPDIGSRRYRLLDSEDVIKGA